MLFSRFASFFRSSPLSYVRSLGICFGLWSFRFPPVLVRTGRRLPVQALGERRVLVAVTGYPRGGAPGPGRSFVTRATRDQREIWYMESGPSRVNAPLGDL